MTVKTPVLTDANSQTVSTYNKNVDANFNVADRIAWAFAPHEQATPDMTVMIDAGHIPAVGELPLEVAAQSTDTITAPSANPRFDIVYIDATDGAVGVATGTEAALPVDPELPESAIAIARVTLSVSQIEITNDDIDDLRSSSAMAAIYNNEAAGKLPRGYIDGYILSNNSSDSEHDLDIAPGAARDDGNSDDIELAASLTKQIDAIWAEGSDAGGLDTGTVAADSTYHVFAIKNSTNGTVDVLFSASVAAPTMPAGYDQKRRIGAVITDDSANIVRFVQVGDWFWKYDPVNDTSTPLTTTPATYTLKVPTGLRLHVMCSASIRRLYSTVSADFRGTDQSISIGDLDNALGILFGTGVVASTNDARSGGCFWVVTDTSGQIQAVAGNGDQSNSSISSKAWIDPRGKNQ